MQLRIGLAALATLLAGCNSERSAVEEKVRDVLTDPDSAKFGDFFSSHETGKACIFVNSKNRYGGYDGSKPLFFEKKGDRWAHIPKDSESTLECSQDVVNDPRSIEQMIVDNAAEAAREAARASNEAAAKAARDAEEAMRRSDP